MGSIKFGTDGWRAIIAKDFTVDNVARVASATADWLSNNFDHPSCVVGYDCRFGGPMFAETVAKILVQKGIKVYLHDSGPVSTPMVSLGAVKHRASLGVIITASHNPPTYNGYKLKGHFGGPLLPNEVAQVEELIPDENRMDLDSIDLEKFRKEGRLESTNLEDQYVEHAQNHFDLKAIAESGMNLAYDPMYGAGQDAMRRLLPDLTYMHADHNPGFEGVAPEPILKNLGPFCEMIQLSKDIDAGLATDGDADRLGFFDQEGNFIDSHHLILLLIHYLVKYKGMTGKVVTAFSVTDRVKNLCTHYGLEQETTKIGFKYIAGHFLDADVLLGGEESGGIAIKGHIPERDGIWMGLTLWEFMAKSGKSLGELIEEIYELVGRFQFSRNDLHITDELKHKAMKACADGVFTNFGNRKVERVETIDGYKFHFDKGEWLMIRPSGTEPVLRTYAESSNMDGVNALLADCESAIRGL